MRLPESLEAELKQFARATLLGSLENITQSKSPRRRRRSKAREVTFENAEYWVIAREESGEILAETIARDPVEAIRKAELHFGRVWLGEIQPEGWELFPIVLDLPDWRKPGR